MFQEIEFLFAPTEPVGGTPAPPVDAKATEPPPSVSAPGASSTPASATESPTQETPIQAAVAESAPSWLDGLRKAGWSGTETDESKVINQLVQAQRDAEQLRPYATHLAAWQQHAPKFQEYLAAQVKPTPAAEQDWTQQLGWNPPPWDPNWRHQVTQDAQGNIIPVPGAPPDVVPKYQAYQQFRTQQIEKLLENPYKFMEPAIKHWATQIAQEQAQQNVGQYQDNVSAETFIQQNSPWIYAQGADGRINEISVFNPQTGRHEMTKQLSQWGTMFRDKLNEYAQRGYPAGDQKELAMKDIQLAFMQTPEGLVAMQKQFGQPAAASQSTTPAPPPQTAREKANGRFTSQTNPVGKSPGANASPAPVKVTKNNFEQVLLQRMREADGVA